MSRAPGTARCPRPRCLNESTAHRFPEGSLIEVLRTFIEKTNITFKDYAVALLGQMVRFTGSPGLTLTEYDACRTLAGTLRDRFESWTPILPRANALLQTDVRDIVREWQTRLFAELEAETV